MKRIGIGTAVSICIALFIGAVALGDKTEAFENAVPAEPTEVVERAYDPSEDVKQDMPELDIESVTMEEVPADPGYTEYTVQYNDSLWGIAHRAYGDGKLYPIIIEDNNLKHPVVIHPGDVLKIYDHESLTVTSVQYSASPEKETKPVAESKPVNHTSTNIPASNASFEAADVMTAAAMIKDKPNEDTSGMKYIGKFRVTGYDPHCKHCCGKTNGITSSGRPAEFGITVGCNSLPAGTNIYMEGYGYFRVDDTGGMANNVIDIAAPSHDVCYQMTGSANVYIVE